MSNPSSSSATLPPGIERGKKYRFVVKSAEEAIATLRERLGEDAKVISVKQIDGQGLGRFLNSPKLEIVATVPEISETNVETAPAEQVPPSPPIASPAARQKPLEAQPLNSVGRQQPDQQEEDPVRDELEHELESQAQPAPQSSNPYLRKQPKREESRSDVWTVLRKAGFAENFISSLHYGDGIGSRIDSLSLPRALAEINRRLRLEYQGIPQTPLANRVAFFGTPGVGKTTALCKRLANDVFMERRSVQVLKLESDTPNPDDALSLFCDVLGVPLLRDPADLDVSDEENLIYVDLPGVPLHEQREWQGLRTSLDKLQVESRVLVVHGMYDADLIGASFDLGERMGATHIAVTHVDEMPSATKLWPYILRGGLSPLFVSHGQNVTSDYSQDVLQVLLEKTFPATVIN